MCMTTIKGLCVAAALTGGGTYDLPTPEIAYSYNGEATDVSRFYEEDNQQFTVGLGILVENTLVHINYDNGFNSEKLSINESAVIHVTQNVELDDKWSLSLTAGASFGGEQKHSACTDSLGREYYCGDLTAWSDFQAPEQDRYTTGSIKLSYKL